MGFPLLNLKFVFGWAMVLTFFILNFFRSNSWDQICFF